MGRTSSKERAKLSRVFSRNLATWEFIPLALTALIALPFSGCDSQDSGQQDLNTAFDVDPNPPTPVPSPSLAAQCYNDRFTQPAAEISRKIDILFVTDTSSSLDDEMPAIADGIDSFVAALPAQVDYQIGVMLAHGSKSTYAGKLFKSNTEPLVLSSNALSLANIRTYLKYKFTHLKTDNNADGGEEGLYSLSRGLDSDRMSVSQTQGFFRSDAALAIVFISDENDICARFPAGVTRVPDPQGSEAAAFVRDCANVTAESVVAKLKAFQGDRPLLVSGIVYTDRATYPRTGENEYGYGWIDAIRDANGLAIDLASGNYAQGLSNIGQLATVKLNLATEFPISHTAIDGSTVNVNVDGTMVPFNYAAGTNEVFLNANNAGGSLSTIDVSYCMKPVDPAPLVSSLCKAGSFVQKPVLKLGLSSDLNDGSSTQITSGLTQIGYTPTYYRDADIIAGKLEHDGVTVLIISRKVTLTAENIAYIQAIQDYALSGGSIVGEYDGAALMFDSFSGAQPIISHLTPSLALFSGGISGGGALLPIDVSTTYITDHFDPIMQGMPDNFLIGLKVAFALNNYDSVWLHPSAQFVSQGTGGLVPAGSFPAVLSGRCGQGRVALFMMNYLQIVNQSPVDRMVGNAIKWVSGQI